MDNIEASPESSAVYSAKVLWNIAADAAQRASEYKSANPGSATTDTLVAVIMSAVSAECFINELPLRITGPGRGARERLANSPGGSDWVGAAEAIELMEQENSQVLSKYMVASVMLPGDPLSTGTQPYQDFALLVAMRNALVHPKVVEDPPTNINPDRTRRIVSYFENRNWTFTAGGAYVTDWKDKIQTPDVARWACRSSSAVIMNMIARIGEDNHPMTRTWRNTDTDPRVIGTTGS